MPTYEYACKDCGEHLEVVQSFTDDALTECPSCNGNLRKVFSPIGIAFKGQGFYKTDSRSSSTSSGAAKSDNTKSETSSTSDSSSATSDSKSDSSAKKSDKKSESSSTTKSEAKSA